MRRRLLAALTLALLIAFAILVVGATAAHAETPGLVVASTPQYSTSILVTSTPALTSPITLNFSLCGIGPSWALVTVKPGGADVARNVGVASCLPPFTIFAVPPSTVTAQSIITYDDGKNRSSFTLGAIGALSGDEVIELGWVGDGDQRRRWPLVCDDFECSYITMFPTVPETPFYLTLYDARGIAPPVVEQWPGSGPAHQHGLEHRGVWFATLQLGKGIPAPYACWPKVCSDYGTIYGLASSGTPDGGSFRAYPFPVTP